MSSAKANDVVATDYVDQMIEKVSQDEEQEKEMSARHRDVEEAQAAKDEAESRNKPKVVFVMGGPGAGKGTQCDHLKRDFGFSHISTGDLLRFERARGGEMGKKIDEIMNSGELVSSELTVQLVKNAMVEAGWDKFEYLIDGFPVNQENIDSWEDIFGDSVDLKQVIMLEVDDDKMKERVLERAKTSGRADDNEETALKKIQTYHEETVPVASHFESKGVLQKIDANRDDKEVYADVKKCFQ